MKRAVVIALLLIAASTMAAQKPDDYPISIHVRSSYYLSANGGVSQVLDTLIDGKKYQLSAAANGIPLLALGDYKAKLTKDEHKTSYESDQIYEFHFPDGKSRKFYVMGLSE